MATKEPFEIPVGMRRVCRRFERWRKGHQARLPIPEALWAEAAKAAREHGVFRASKALHLEYGKLKRMAGTSPASVRPTVAPATFLELMPPQTVGLAECLIELEGLRGQLAEHKTEPNSGLGKAISYLLNHRLKLTLFLRQAGAPLGNNIVERALKKAILNRRNALFYKTLNGAGVGDLFMSLIHTCELNGANSFDYLTELLRHAEELRRNPSEWMPWNYRETLARLATPAAA